MAAHDYPMKYELCIRRAFGGIDKVERHGDPAGLANTDWFSSHNFERAQVGLAYAISIYLNGVNDPKLYQQLDTLFNKTLSARTIKDLTPIVDDLSNLQKSLS